MMNNRIKKLTIASLAAISICIPFVVDFEGNEPVMPIQSASRQQASDTPDRTSSSENGTTKRPGKAG